MNIELCKIIVIFYNNNFYDKIYNINNLNHQIKLKIDLKYFNNTNNGREANSFIYSEKLCLLALHICRARFGIGHLGFFLLFLKTK